MQGSLISRVFGFLPTGECVRAWTLTGGGGLTLEVMEWGGTVTRLLVPDRHGRMEDVVLGFADLDSYLSSKAYFGAVAGRVAGRITGARFSLAGREHFLTANDGVNHLHGGRDGFHRQVWAAEPLRCADETVSLRLTHTSADGSEGYPGTVQVAVTYSVTTNNVLRFESEAVADQLTPLSLTHHSYFNLAGEPCSSIADHELQIYSDCIVPADACMTLLGRLEPVSEANDFRTPRALGRAMAGLFQHHGDLYRLKDAEGAQGSLMRRPAARLVDPARGRVLQVATTEDYLQIYTAAGLHEQRVGKSGRRYGRHSGICLECEGYPDSLNAPHLGNILLEPGVPRRSITEYAFSTTGIDPLLNVACS